MLSKTSLQIIKALVELAHLPQGQSAGAARVAKRIRAPQNYLGKMLQQLSHKGLVVSKKGFGGGFRLAKSPAKIRLFDVINPIDDVGRWDSCFLGRKHCSEKNACQVHHQWSVVHRGYMHFLKNVTLADLM
ncbi:MAG: Rrf2 family transcriptional regulator [Deltaproteobacteria bacterium]|nr:Rrf2 family transcriptional regulator [Deltaproteobacteria bacterium]